MNLAEPSWTSDGEILNVDRFAFLAEPVNDGGVKFVRLKGHSHFSRKTKDFLNQTVQRLGFAYKDVTQPFIIAEWLTENQYPVIRIKRSVVDVAYAMIRNNWLYPSRNYPDIRPLEYSMIVSLMEADKALDSISAQVLHFDELIVSEIPLRNALKKIYGNDAPKHISYLDENFREKRDAILARRKTREYQKLARYLKMAG